MKGAALMRQRNVHFPLLLLTTALILTGFVAIAVAQPNYAKVKEYRIERSVPP
jgi:hydroxylamine dehydrogenase